MVPSPMAGVRLNGQPIPDAEGLSLAELLQRLGEAPDKVATALNGEFIPRHQRDHARLEPGDHVTTFKAIVGG